MKKILIVDDAEFNIDLLEQLLEDDYELVVAENGAEAVEQAQSEKPDLILMDIAMPVMDGYDATRRIKANPELSDIPIMAITSHAKEGDRQKTFDAGCDDYLSKPIDEDVLLEKVANLLKA